MIDLIPYFGWILSIIFAVLAYYYYRQSAHAHKLQLENQKIQLEWIKISRVLDDDYKRAGCRRGIVETDENGWPHIAWVVGAEPSEQSR